MNKTQIYALLALIIFAPAPSIGVLAALHGSGGTLGVLTWIGAKIWLFVLPILWILFLQKERIPWALENKSGLVFGLLLGLAMMGVIFLSFYLFAGRIDPDLLRSKLSSVHLANIWIYLAAALYWILFNSLLEEIIFRFFFFRQIEILFGRAWLASILAALIFTLHHILALAAYCNYLITALASLGVFIAGLLWSVLFARYRSLIPSYIAHICADVAVFSLGGYLLFMA